MSNETAQALPGATPLTLEGDPAAQVVEALDRYVTDLPSSPELARTISAADLGCGLG